MKRSLLIAGLSLIALGANAQQRVPLFEVFTSSTCPPCRPGNQIYENVVGSKPASEYVSIKFQQNFPGTGDPYCTQESYARRGYYAINSVPRMEIDGGWDGNANSFNNNLYTQAQNEPATYELSGTFSVVGQTVNATVNYKPLSAGTNPVLYVAIIETETVQNVKTNGETKFYHVFKKFMPSQSGTDISSTAVNTEATKTLTFAFQGKEHTLPVNGQQANWINHDSAHSVENFANLKVVAWVQGSDKAVYQAANLTSTGATSIEAVSKSVAAVNTYPNPASNKVTIDFDMTESDKVSALIVSVNGAVVKNQTATMNKGKNQMTFDTQDLASGFYNLIIFDSNNNSFAQRLVIAH